MKHVTNTKTRIGYIDALRGFTMILVVCHHIITSCHEITDFSFAGFFMLFRMPLFFFISGFVLYKASRKWDYTSLSKFLKAKFLIQVIPTLIFLFLFNLIFNLSSINLKINGYWFTIALFEFFVIYGLLSSHVRCIKNMKLGGGIILIITGLILYIFGNKSFPFYIMAFFSLPLHYFIFFAMGIICKKYFNLFQSKILDNNISISFIIATFFILSIVYLKFSIDIFIIHIIIELILGCLGIITIFALFRKNKVFFEQSNYLSNGLKFIGRRTLDIYLLHFFFIQNILTWILPYLQINPSPTLELIIALILSFLVIGLCLFLSSILRVSPFIAKYLFGSK